VAKGETNDEAEAAANAQVEKWGFAEEWEVYQKEKPRLSAIPETDSSRSDHGLDRTLQD